MMVAVLFPSFFLNVTVNARDAVFVLCVCLSVMFGVVLFFFGNRPSKAKIRA